MVRHPQRHLGNLAGELINLDPIEMIDLQLGDFARPQRQPGARGIDLLQHAPFQIAQFAIGNDQEIARPAGRVKKGQPRQPIMKGAQRGVAAAVLARLQGGELVVQFFQEQRADDAKDRLFRGVMRALPPPGDLVDHSFKQRAEDRRRDLPPVEVAGVDQPVAQRIVEMSGADRLGEQAPVDIGIGAEMIGQAGLALIVRRVEHIEQLRQERAEIAAIGASALLQIKQQLVLGPDMRVVGEQHEQQPDQQQLQLVPAIAVRLQLPVQPRQQLGRSGVDRPLVLELPHLCPRDEGECGDVFLEIGQVEGKPISAIVQIKQPPPLKVAGEDIAGPINLRQPIVIIERLIISLTQIKPCRFLLDDQLARHEQVDEALPVTGQVLHPLLIDRHLAAIDAETGEEFVVESLRIAMLASAVLMPLGKCRRLGANL